MIHEKKNTQIIRRFWLFFMRYIYKMPYYKPIVMLITKKIFVIPKICVNLHAIAKSTLPTW